MLNPTSRPEPWAAVKLGMPDVVVKRLMAPVISRRNARSAKDHAVRSVPFASFALIPRLASTKAYMATCTFWITSCTPGTGVKTNSSEGHARDTCSPH